MRPFFRRDFLKKTGLAILASGCSFPAMATTPAPLKRIKPPRLSAGARVALIAPCSPPSDEKLEKALQNLQNMGLQVVEGKSLRSRNGYLAGNDAARIADIHWAFQDNAIDAVWCVRGGYGATRLLPDINFQLIRQHPKLFIGYSDVTALHLAIQARTGLVTFHGPVAAGDFPEDTLHHLQQVVTFGHAPHRIEAPRLPQDDPMYQPFTIAPGKVQGVLTGGNLALLAAMAGTDFAPVFKDKLVFIEDVGEQPYRLDRMLTQLLQATDLAAAAGIVLGVFNECQPKPDSASWSLPDTLRDRLGNLGIPVAYGIPFGHVSSQATLPYGIKAEWDATDISLTLLEVAVQ
jgi:muramoyltetrapeptide carboxypeptidase